MRKLIQGINDLATVRPELAAEWHPTKNGELKADQITCGSGKKVWWLGKCGHEWSATVINRAKGQGCSICAGKTVLPGFNDMATVHPKLAAEWHPTQNGSLLPENVFSYSHEKVWWKCKNGHEWIESISVRATGVGCPFCAGKRVIPGVNDLATVNPVLAAEWHPAKNGNLLPKNVFPHSIKKVWWLGKCGHEWEVSVTSRSNGKGCPYCTNRKVLKGFNDLETTHPDLAAEWHPIKNGELKADQITYGSEKKVWWLCPKCRHEWRAMVYNRAHGNNCPECNEYYYPPKKHPVEKESDLPLHIKKEARRKYKKAIRTK